MGHVVNRLCMHIYNLIHFNVYIVYYHHSKEEMSIAVTSKEFLFARW